MRLLHERGHPVDCEDDSGWPPLLYANFKSSEHDDTAQHECVLSLMRPKPEQLIVLGRLLNQTCVSLTQNKRNRESVAKVLCGLATTDEFYAVLNDFISAHPQLLDDSLEFLWQCKGLVNFRNKSQWFRRKMRVFQHEASQLGAYSASFVTFRDTPLLSMHNGLQSASFPHHLPPRVGVGVELHLCCGV